MYPKKKIEKLIDKYAEPFRKALGIKNIVKFHVYSGKSKKYKKLATTRVDLQGVSFISSEGYAEIIVFYDQHTNERDAVGTIFHELLHVRLFKLTGMITLKAERANVVEEKFVRDLEELFLKIFYDGKL